MAGGWQQVPHSEAPQAMNEEYCVQPQHKPTGDKKLRAPKIFFIIQDYCLPVFYLLPIPNPLFQQSWA